MLSLHLCQLAIACTNDLLVVIAIFQIYEIYV